MISLFTNAINSFAVITLNVERRRCYQSKKLSLSGWLFNLSKFIVTALNTVKPLSGGHLYNIDRYSEESQAPSNRPSALFIKRSLTVHVDQISNETPYSGYILISFDCILKLLPLRLPDKPRSQIKSDPEFSNSNLRKKFFWKKKKKRKEDYSKFNCLEVFIIEFMYLLTYMYIWHGKYFNFILSFRTWQSYSFLIWKK